MSPLRRTEMVLPPVKMFDASIPPATAPPGYRAVAGYIGGDTPHVWTEREWRRFGKLRKLPIWVRSDPTAVSAEADAFAALEPLYNLKVPRGITVALDLETSVDAGYVRTFHGVMRWAGFYVWVYGSASTVFRNPAADGYWVADYAGKGPFMYSHRFVKATQYQPGQHYDSSLVKYWPYYWRMWK
jgi:hypothetical protein